MARATFGTFFVVLPVLWVVSCLVLCVLPCESCLVSLFSSLVGLDWYCVLSCESFFLVFWALSYLVSLVRPLLSLVSHKKYTFSNVAGKSLLLPRWQGQSTVGVQPRRDEGLSRQPQKVVFSSRPQLFILTTTSHRCLALAPSNDKLLLEKCDPNEPAQRWRFGNYNATGIGR